MESVALILDVGTTGIKALAFDQSGQELGRAYRPLSQTQPHPGWVEQNPLDYLLLSQQVIQEVTERLGSTSPQPRVMGITNQRESIVAWDVDTGEPVAPAILWQDQRTLAYCQALQPDREVRVREKTGLSLLPYFSASKIHWILQNVPRAAELVAQKRLRVGTVDSWLNWHWLVGHPHLTDQTNASRTLLYNIHTLQWDAELLELFQLPLDILPQVLPSATRYGQLKPDIVEGALPVQAVMGDQQASMYAALQLRLSPSSRPLRGCTKVTFGTGIFLSQYLGDEYYWQPPFSTTLQPTQGSLLSPHYCLEVKVEEHCGSQVESLIDRPGETQAMETLLRRFAEKVQQNLRLLPLTPHELVVDGGVLRRPPLIPILEEVTGLPIRPQIVYDGTALGVALMLSPRSI